MLARAVPLVAAPVLHISRELPNEMRLSCNPPATTIKHNPFHPMWPLQVDSFKRLLGSGVGRLRLGAGVK